MPRRPKTTKAARKNSATLRKLEDRILFDAVMDAGTDPNVGDGSQGDANLNAAFQSYEQDVATYHEEEATSTEQSSSSMSDSQVRHELVIVDTSVDNFQQLVDDLMNNEDEHRNIEVVLLDADSDGVEQVSEVLSQYRDLDALHLVTHGDDAAFRLGNTWVTSENLSANAGLIARWGEALNSTGDLLLYGCDLAETAEGRELVDSLAELTGTDVAASDDDTGVSHRGGDWDLEYTNGTLESSVVFSQHLQVSYNGVLAVGPDVEFETPSQQVQLGEDFDFTITFDNTGTDVGYGPYIDLIFPVNGADGAAGTDTVDGIDFVGATYLGQSLNSIELVFPDDDGAGVGTTGTIDHPFAVDSSGNPFQITGTAGDKLVVLELPFGSFAPDQPQADIVVTATTNSLADLGTDLIIQSRSGFRFGSDPLNNPTAPDPTVVSDPGTDVSDASNPANSWVKQLTITPTLLTLEKIYLGPESETATGPNHQRQYRIDVDIATGQTISNLDIIDSLPNNVVVTSIDEVRINGAVTTDYSDNLSALSFPGNNLDLVITPDAAVTGTTANADVSVTFSFYVAEVDANGDRVIPVSGEDDTTSAPDSRSLNNARAVGDWIPVDGRDSGGTNNAVADPSSGPEHILDDKSIAIQKTVNIVNNTGAAGATPGDTLEYILRFQISDYYTFGDLVIRDVFQDGQSFDFGYGATFDITDMNGNVTGNFTVRQVTDADGGQTLVVDQTQIDNADNTGEDGATPDGSDGSTTLTFDLSKVLTDNSAADGILQGGRTTATNQGGAFGTIRFRTVIQDQFSDSFGSGDRSVDQGDSITNNSLTISGSVRENAEDGDINSTTGVTESDSSSTSVRIQGGSLVKEVYAINGNTTLPNGPSGKVSLTPGDVVTYRIEYTLATSDFENLKLTDFLPLPIFDVQDHNADGVIDASDNWTFNVGSSFDATAPASGVIEFGAGDTFYNSNATDSSIIPTISVNPGGNALELDYGSYDDPSSSLNTIELYVSVTAQNSPTADGLFLTNIVRAEEGTTNSTPTVIDRIVQIEVTQPELSITKGIVSTDSTTAEFDNTALGPAGITFGTAGTADPLFSGGNITSDGLALQRIDSNITNGIDAGDRIRYAIVLENTGNSTRGAYDVQISDALPDGFSLVSGSVQVVDGTGAALTYSGAEADLFTTGIELNDPGATPDTGDGTNAGAVDGYNATSGRNVVIIFYDVTADSDVAATQTYTNTASLTNYAGQEGGDNHAATPLTDEAFAVAAGFTATKTVVSTSESHTGVESSVERVTIGEIVRYRIQVALPEGTLTDFQIRDLMPTGLTFIDDGTSLVTFVSDNSAITSSTLVGAGYYTAGNETNVASISPTDAFGDGDVSRNANNDSDNYTTSGRDVYFKLGDVVNTDNDANTEYVIVEFNALVDNTVSGGNDGGTAGSPDGGDNRDNSLRLYYDANNNGSVNTSDEQFYSLPSGDRPRIRITEPHIENIDKTANVSGGDAGDVVTYTISFDVADGDGRSNAFDIRVLDSLPSELSNLSLTEIRVGAATLGSGFTDNTAGDVLDLVIDQVAKGTTVEVDFTATIQSGISPGDVITNEVDITWSSLPGEYGTADGSGGNSTGSDLQSLDGTNTGGMTYETGSGSAYGERNGNDAGNNDYLGDDSHSITIDLTPAVTKTLDSTSINSAGNGTNDAVIGEIVTYTVTLNLNEVTMDNARLVDTLDAGLAFVDVTNVTTTGGVSFTGDGNNPDSVTSNGRVITWELGTISDATSDDGNDGVAGDSDGTIEITYRAIVTNANTNQSAQTLDNSVRFTWDDDPGTAPNPRENITATADNRVNVVEPEITIVKNAAVDTDGDGFDDGTTADAGDDIRYTIQLTNTSGVDAFDLGFVDNLPMFGGSSTILSPSFTVVDTAGIVTAANFTLSGSNVAGWTLQSTGNIDFAATPGRVITLEIDGTLAPDVQPEQVIANNASVTWHSIDGDIAVGDQSAHTTDDTERTGADGSTGNPNNYASTDSANITVLAPTILKQIVSTGINNGSTNTDAHATIGEFITYSITIDVPEVGIPTVEIIDQLDAGLEFVRLDNVVASAALSTDAASDDFATTATFNPTVTGDGSSATPYGLTFDLGTISNSDNDNSVIEQITLTYTVRVMNSVDADGNGSSAGDSLNNTARMQWNSGVNQTAGESVAIEVVEADLNVDKQLTSSTTGDAGDTVTYEITISHTANSDTDAFDVTFSDALPDEITFGSFQATLSTAGDLDTLLEYDSGTNTVRTIAGQSFDLDFGEDVVITITGTLATAETEPGEIISNTANVQWTSLDNANADDGDDANERGGSGVGENDYSDSSTNTALAISEPTVAKTLIGTSVDNVNNGASQAVVGETATYQVVLTLTEGTYASLQLIDTLSSGYEFISIDNIVAESDGAATTDITTSRGTGDFSDLTTFNPTTGGGDHIFDLGTVTNANTNNGDVDTLTITYTVRVTNTVGNNGNGSGTGTSLDNEAQLSWTADGSTETSNTSSAATVEVIEPDLTILKAVNNDTPNLGETVTYTLTINHSAASDTDAYDLVISDTLPEDLTLNTGTISVTLGGSVLTVVDDYAIVTGSNGFRISGLDLLDSGEALVITYDADVTTDIADIGNSYNNTGNLTWTSLDGASGNERDGDGGNAGEDDYADSSLESLTIIQPDLRITKENGVAAVVPGSTYTYNIVVFNDGNDTATGVNVQDFLDGSIFDLSSVTTDDASNVTYDSGTGELNWDAGSINATTSKTLQVTVSVRNSLAAGINDVTNSASATHDDIDPTNNNTGSDTDTVNANPVLTLTKSDGQANADLDDTLTYTLNYANTGNQDATGVQIIETVPSGTTFAGTADWTDIGGGRFRFDIGNLAAGASGSVTFQVTVNDPQPIGQHTISNSATIDDDNTNGGTAGIDATATDDTDVPSSIAGRVYNDFDNDGSFDAVDGEHGIESVRIELYDTSSGSPVFVGFTNTAADGTYSFSGLLGDQYEIRQTQPTDYNDGLESDGSEGNGSTVTNDRITSIELNAGVDATNYNFGERGVSIEGTVFVDNDRDGSQQTGETTGIDGVTVELYDSTGTTLIATTTTRPDGSYSFDNLPAGDYILRQTHPTLYTSTSPDQIAATVPLAGLTDQDFGEALSDLGNFVWFDANNDGLQTGEEGLADVDVTLTYGGADNDLSTIGDNVVYHTTTDANGFYSFTELFNGNYTVEIDAADLPSGVTGTTETDDSSAAIDGTSNITIGGSDRFDVDFGFTGGGSIGDFVFLDVDGDGVQDAEDVGLANVTVNVVFAGADGVIGNDDDLSFTTVTDSDGRYSVDNLPGGNFEVSVDTTDTDLLGSVVGVSGTESNSGTVSVTLADNETNDDVDFGFAGTLSLGDRLWFDGNGDGVQDVLNEPGLAEVEVTLNFAGQDGIFNNADDITLTDTTDANGNYQFDNLADGEYRITYNSLDLPQGMSPTHEIDDSAAAVDGTSNITLNGSNRDDVDFGFRGAGSIGNFVWHDVDGDGVQDSGEPGLAGITVDLQFAGDDGVFDTSDDFRLTTETDANGSYGFANLADGNYRVNVDAADAELPGNMTGVAGAESISGTANVTLDATNGRNQDDIDFGFAGTQSVGDFVWFDADGDGNQDVGEPGLGDVAVTLTYAGQDGAFGTTDDVMLNTTTDASGGYNFGLLADGNYRVAVDVNDLPTGLTQTTETNDGASTLVHTAEFSVGGSDRDDIDFGYTGALTIGDTIYYDADGSGGQNGGEPGIAGVDVTLGFAGEDGVFGTDDDFQLTTTTDGAGSYRFEHLPEGDFELTVDTSSLPDGMTTITEEFDDTGVTNDGTATVTLSATGGNNDDVDFGFMGTGSIGDTVFWDQDADGFEDANEIGLAGLTVELDIDYDSDGNIDHTLSTLTDVNGEYIFDNLPAGRYTVRVTQPAGTTQTYDDDGLGTPNASTYDLASGQDVDDKDFGYRGNSSIGDTIFFDYSGNGGAFDPSDNDRGIAGVDVTLEIDVDGDGTIDVTRVQTTDGDGNYNFANLIAGNYTVNVDSNDLPDAMGLNPTFDIDGTTDNTTRVTLGLNETNDDTDFGYHATPDYVITKDDGLSNVVPGQTIDYTITLTNNGTFRGQNVVVTDTFPTDILENVSATVNGISGGAIDMSAGTITWNLSSVGMGETVTIVVMADVINPLNSGIAGLTNVVTVADDAFNGVDPNTTNNSDDDVNTVTAQPDYQIVKTNDLTQAAVPGQTFNYFLQVTNNGNQGGTGVMVSDTLPINVLDGFSVVTDDAANVVYDPTTGNLVWDAGSIAGGGGTKTLTVTVTVQEPVGQLVGSFDNSASVTDDGNNGTDPDLTDNTSVNTVGLNATPDYQIEKTSNLTETAMVGDSFEYTITVTNIGDQNGTGVTVTDMIPTSVVDRNQVTTDDPSNVNYDASTGELIWDVGSLDGRGGSATLTIFVTIPFVIEDPLADVIINTATVTDDGLNGPDLDPSNNSSTREDDVLVFAFDSFNNFANPFGGDRSGLFGDDDRTEDRTLKPIPVDPIFSGLAEPGTTLNLRIYDQAGNVIGERQVVADAGGNWVANFPNAVIWKHPHRMDVEQTAPIQSDVNRHDGFNMRRYFHPATHSSLFFSERDTVQSIERNSAYETINSMHEANNNPLQVGWKNHLYQLNVSSTNASAR